MKEKGDPCILVGYSTQSKGYRVYNKRTRLIVESIHIRFDEIKEMSETSVDNNTSSLVLQQQKASDYNNSSPAPQLQNVSPSADTTAPSQDDLARADGQSKRMIQNLEDIMRACVIDFGGSYQLSLRCAPFEALYGRKCRSPVLWAEIGGSSWTGLELVQETTDKVVLVKEKPKAARDRQKSYVDYRHKPLEFEVRDRVLLKVTPWKGVVHFEKKGKLASRYVVPFEILERIGLVAYRLSLLEELNSMHDSFHVSSLKKYLADANLHVPLDEIKVDKTLRFVEEPIEIMDREIKKLKHRKIALVKVRWNSKRSPKFTWEHEDQMRIKYPQLFKDRVVEPAS
ncbi:hypothetical protein Tco_1031235 [Tanacetum coccineum]|uniref:Reverse transcriptase domain-containing protein n=1 Tax=Tanacetum coccineum TaxID=301880 RepID=A0ABQ5G8M2_9ASTR